MLLLLLERCVSAYLCERGVVIEKRRGNYLALWCCLLLLLFFPSVGLGTEKLISVLKG